jgi:heme exporter protein A
VTVPAALDFETLEVRELSRHFGRRRALSRVTLACRAGEIVGILGPNGSGKSTLLGACATLVRPSSGEVRYGGRTAAELGDRLRGRIGVLGHDLFLYGDLTAGENLEFFARLYGLADPDARVARALGHARLEDREHDRVAGFSRGLRQRLALERALLHDPRLVLLDEPFTGLDDESSALLGERLRGLRGAGAIVLMATHEFDTAAAVVDRAACLSQGKLLAETSARPALRDWYRQVVGEGRA